MPNLGQWPKNKISFFLFTQSCVDFHLVSETLIRFFVRYVLDKLRLFEGQTATVMPRRQLCPPLGSGAHVCMVRWRFKMSKIKCKNKICQKNISENIFKILFCSQIVVILHYYDCTHTHAHTHKHTQSPTPAPLGQTSYT